MTTPAISAEAAIQVATGRFRRGLGERLTGAGSTRARRVGADATRWPMT
jgi:predicted N-acetyltransferase YhbS